MGFGAMERGRLASVEQHDARPVMDGGGFDLFENLLGVIGWCEICGELIDGARFRSWKDGIDSASEGVVGAT